MVKLWAEILLKFQWHIEKLCPKKDFGPGFVSISPLNNMKNVIGKVTKPYNTIKYKKNTKTLRIRKVQNLE